MWLLRCLSPRACATTTPGLKGTRLAPRETAPVDSARPDLGDGGGRPSEVCTASGPAADVYASRRSPENQELMCTFGCTSPAPRRSSCHHRTIVLVCADELGTVLGTGVASSSATLDLYSLTRMTSQPRYDCVIDTLPSWRANQIKRRHRSVDPIPTSRRRPDRAESRASVGKIRFG